MCDVCVTRTSKNARKGVGYSLSVCMCLYCACFVSVVVNALIFVSARVLRLCNIEGMFTFSDNYVTI